MKKQHLDKPVLRTRKEALAFVKRHGLVTLLPIKGTDFPSLYASVVGKSKEERLERTWNWADSLAQQKRLYYGKLAARQVTLVSLEVFPYVFRLHHMQDELSETTTEILAILGRHGPTSTTNLRKQLKLMGKERKSTFTKALDQSQLDLAVAIVSREKSPQMTYTWDLIERWMPKELLEKAARTSETEAKDKVVAKLLKSGAITKPEEAVRLLRWRH